MSYTTDMSYVQAQVERVMYPDELALAKEESAVTQRSTRESLGQGIGLTFDELFERYNSMVFGLLYHILGDREEALDVSQDVFLTIFRKMDSFRGESSLKTWIYCITVHRAANRFRWWNRLRRRGTVSLEEHLANNPDRETFYNLRSNVQSPEDVLLRQEERAAMENLLLQLPWQQRIAVIMRDIQGLSYEEIAQSMQISIGTVKSRIARGRETLKRHFKGAKS
jgi:RNA polymerase sigma-70 factor (ECF subfamily)